MNSKENLKSTKFILILGFCLILTWLFIFSQKPKVETISIVTPTPPITPIFTFAKVTRVIDGDTIVIDSGQHVRYIGMNTPEIETNECFATEASEINKNLVLGKIVKLEKDVSETDKYGRLLRYVYVGDTLVDDYLVKNGDAKVMTILPDIRYKNEFLSSQTNAKENNLGLWRKCFK